MNCLKKILFISFVFALTPFGFAQQAVEKEHTDDLCTGINKIMTYSFQDYSTILEGEQITKIGLTAEHYWKSKYHLTGFADNTIRFTVVKKKYFSAVYFRDADHSKVLAKYNELIEMVRSCTPKLCCEFTPSSVRDMDDMKRYEFWIDKSKKGFDQRHEELYITVNYILETDTKEAVVFLNILPKE